MAIIVSTAKVKKCRMNKLSKLNLLNTQRKDKKGVIEIFWQKILSHNTMAKNIPKEKRQRKSLQQEIIMLRTQGFTVRQICSILQVKSKDVVLKHIKSYIENIAQKEDIGAREY